MKSITHTRRTERHGTEYWTCCFCRNIFTGFGNNPDSEDDNDECCDSCNDKHVIPARLGAMFGGAS
jgi:hypothetical protein